MGQLLNENLTAVFAERDPSRRMAAIERLFDPECAFCDPRGRHTGHTALDQSVAALLSEFPDYAFSALGSADIVQDCGRLNWAFGPPDDPQRITGLDIVIVSRDRITTLYTFLNTPAPDGTSQGTGL